MRAIVYSSSSDRSTFALVLYLHPSIIHTYILSVKSLMKNFVVQLNLPIYLSIYLSIYRSSRFKMNAVSLSLSLSMPNNSAFTLTS